MVECGQSKDGQIVLKKVQEPRDKYKYVTKYPRLHTSYAQVYEFLHSQSGDNRQGNLGLMVT